MPGNSVGGKGWWVPASREMGGLSPTSTVYGNGGGGGVGPFNTNGSLIGNTQGIQMRSPLDARRAAQGQLSQAEYPDGYLGTIINRRQDRLVQAVTNRLQRTQTQRGVHKGAIVDPRVYYWPDDEINPDQGLQREKHAKLVVSEDGSSQWWVQRNAPIGEPITILVNDGKTPPKVDNPNIPATQTGTVMDDPMKPLHYDRMLPKYRLGGVSHT